MIKTIFFDFDGVIVESVDIKTKAFAELFKNRGSDAVRKIVDYHLEHTGVSRFDKFKYIYKNIFKCPLSEDEFRRLCNDFEKLVIDAVVKAPYVKGAKEFLNSYAAQYDCYVVSATPQKEIEDIIRKRGIGGFFKGICGSPTDKKNAVADTLKKENLKPVEAVYIGDAMSDYVAAKENFVNFIARLNNNESIFSGLDCLRITDLTALKRIIDGL